MNQAAPTILNAVLNNDGNAITITATAPSAPPASVFDLNFYINNVDNSPITEGQTYIGSVAAVPSNTTILAMFAISHITSNVWVSATATNRNNPMSGVGDTSPFCSNFSVATLPNNLVPIMFK